MSYHVVCVSLLLRVLFYLGICRVCLLLLLLILVFCFVLFVMSVFCSSCVFDWGVVSLFVLCVLFFGEHNTTTKQTKQKHAKAKQKRPKTQKQEQETHVLFLVSLLAFLLQLLRASLFCVVFCRVCS